MKRLAVLVVLTILWSGNAIALTLDEAVEAAKENNAVYQQQLHLQRSAEELEGMARAPFYPSLDLKYSYTRSTEDAFYPEDELSVFTVEAAYNIFNGMTDMYNLKARSSDTSAATYRQLSVRADTVFAAKSAYIGVLRARHAEETAREGVELLERQARDARRFFEAGLKSKRDYLQVEVELASAKQDLAQTEGAYRVARSRLERVMGAPLSAEDALEDLTETPEAPALDYGAMREEMFGQRSELKYLRAQAEANEHRMRAVRGAYLPSVNLVWQYNQYGDSTSPSGREYAYDSDTRTMVTARWRLFGGFDISHAVASAHSLIRAAEAQITETERELEFQLREALEDFNVAGEKLKVAEAAVAQAEENYRVTESSFKQNLATTTDLLDARTFLSRARTQYFGALYDMHQAKARIDRVLERGVY